MRADTETITYYVRVTDPASNKQVAYECVGFAMAHAKTAELRMSGFSDVVMSIPKAGDNETRPSGMAAREAWRSVTPQLRESP
jgi:hypothetical protein